MLSERQGHTMQRPAMLQKPKRRREPKSKEGDGRDKVRLRKTEDDKEISEWPSKNLLEPLGTGAQGNSVKGAAVYQL